MSKTAQPFRRFLFVQVSLLFLASGAILAAQETFSSEESREILSRVDALVTYPNNDFSAEYTILETRPGQGSSRTVINLFRRDRENTYTILIKEPAADRGKGYLRIGNNLWLYDPADRRFTVTSAEERFQNSNARNADFNQSTLSEDYRILGREVEQLGAYRTDVYDLEATHDDVTFPKRRVWIDQNNLVRKMEDYSLSGQHMRTTAIPNYRELGEKYVPVRIVIQDELRGRRVEGEFKHERTMITVEKPSFQELPDMVFTRTFLERASN